MQRSLNRSQRDRYQTQCKFGACRSLIQQLRLIQLSNQINKVPQNKCSLMLLVKVTLSITIN